MRNKKIDVMRGIAIILVVLGHSIGNIENNFNKCILSFHMPLFFIISGLVAKNCYTVDNKIKYVLKRTKLILIPNFIMGIILVLYEIIIKMMILKEITFNEIDLMYCFFGYWFLWTLFFVSILFIIISSLIDLKNKKIQIIVGTVSIILAIFSAYKLKGEYILAWNIIPMAFCFYYFGFIFKDFILSESLIKFVEEKIVFIISIFVTLSLINSPALMYKNAYGNLAIFIVTSILGLFVTIWISNCLEENKMLNFTGRNSIVFYIMHWVVFRSIKGVLNKISIISSNEVLALLTFIISMTILLLIVKIYVYIKQKYMTIKS